MSEFLSTTESLATLVRFEHRHLDPRDVLKRPPSVLLAVNAAQATALELLELRTVFDLATAEAFEHAKTLVAASQNATSMLARHGEPPAHLVREALTAGRAVEDLASMGIEILQAIPQAQTAALSTALGVSTVRDLSLYPGYRDARRILDAIFFPENDSRFDPEAPADLLPRSGEYPTERVQYTSLLMDEIKIGRDTPLIDVTADAFKPLDLERLASVNAGFKHVAFGALLTFRQSWYAQGVTLGQLLHSVSLAPGESTRLAVVDWTRKSRAGQTEVIDEVDDLSNDQTHNRSIGEVTQAVANEAQGGFSSTNTKSKSRQSGEASALDVSAPLGGLFGGPSGSVATSSSRASSETQADSYSSSWGHRDVGSSMMQKVSDRTHQHAHSSRSRRASVVKEVSQSEHESVSTRVIANYNHMHALNVQYYEVVQIYRTEVMLTMADRVIFVPVELMDFSKDDVIRTFRAVLARAALQGDVRESLRNLDVVEIEPDRTSRFTVLDKGVAAYLKETLALPHKALLATRLDSMVKAGAAVADEDPPKSKAAARIRPSALTETARVSSIVPAVALMNDRLWSGEQVSRLANLLDRVVLRPDSSAIYLPNDVLIDAVTVSGDTALGFALYHRNGRRITAVNAASPVAVTDVARIAVTGSHASDEVSAQVTLTLNRSGVRFPLELPAVKVAPGTRAETRVVQFKQGGVNVNLKNHLNANRLHYSRAIFRSLDSTQIATLLAGYGVRAGPQGAMVPVSQVTDPNPVAFVGNFLAFRMNSDTRNDEEWLAWLKQRGIQIGSSKQDIVPLATGGTFAEAVLGRFNCAEKLDITRFWNWKDSPIPLQPTEIAAIQTGSRAQPEDVKPGQLSTPIINITTPTSMPDPVGTAAVLGAVQNGTMFRDMSGLQATIGLAQAALQATAAGAASAGQQAGTNQNNQLQATTERQRIAANMITDLAKTAASVYSGMPAGGGGGGAPASNHSQDGAKINYFDKMGAGSAPAAGAGGAAAGGAPAIEIGGGSSGGGVASAGGGGSGSGSGGGGGGGGGGSFASGFAPASYTYSRNPAALAATWGNLGAPQNEFTQQLFDNAGSLTAEPLKTQPTPANGEINLVGHFVWDPALTDAEEIALLNQNQWSPATVDFKAVMGNAVTVADIQNLMYEIVRHAPGSVSRVNFMTHANDTTIGFSGRNVPGDVIWDIAMNQDRLAEIAEPFTTFSPDKNNPDRNRFTLNEVRQRFAAGAVFVLYGCRAGASDKLAKALHKLFGVRVVAFKQKLGFCPPPQSGTRFVRTGTKIFVHGNGRNCQDNGTADWRGLIGNPADLTTAP
jgi:hypothetical protein